MDSAQFCMSSTQLSDITWTTDVVTDVATYDVTLACEDFLGQTLDRHPFDGQWLTNILHPVVVLVEEVT